VGVRVSAPGSISTALQERLRCPACGGRLSPGRSERGETLRCEGPACGRSYPVVGGVPVLVDERKSLFDPERTAAAMRAAGGAAGGATERGSGPARALVHALTPAISRNVKGEANFARLAGLLAGRPSPRVLVVGGGIRGAGFGPLLATPGLDLLQTDVGPGPHTALICDAHDLPFEAGSFDAVVAQAVLEHVLDPWRCVEELHRVLAPGGLVYAETPFMQQVHEGRFDFTRFTHLGHRRLFRRFEELDSGAVGGPGMALAWSWRYFLWSFARGPLSGSLLTTFASLTSFFLKAFDGPLIDRPRALDAAAGVYFLGRRSETTLSDRELVASYRGAG
jgi:SAM-dependent methyltransferase